MDVAKKGQEVCVKIEPIPGESPKMYGRHFEATDILVSKVSLRQGGLWEEGKSAVLTWTLWLKFEFSASDGARSFIRTWSIVWPRL